MLALFEFDIFRYALVVIVELQLDEAMMMHDSFGVVLGALNEPKGLKRDLDDVVTQNVVEQYVRHDSTLAAKENEKSKSLSKKVGILNGYTTTIDLSISLDSFH